jgi:hypothetical protein
MYAAVVPTLPTSPIQITIASGTFGTTDESLVTGGVLITVGLLGHVRPTLLTMLSILIDIPKGMREDLEQGRANGCHTDVPHVLGSMAHVVSWSLLDRLWVLGRRWSWNRTFGGSLDHHQAYQEAIVLL